MDTQIFDYKSGEISYTIEHNKDRCGDSDYSTIWMNWFGPHTRGSIGVRGTRLEFIPTSAIVEDHYQDDSDYTLSEDYSAGSCYGDSHNMREDHLEKLLEVFTKNNQPYFKLYSRNDSVIQKIQKYLDTGFCSDLLIDDIILEKVSKYHRDRFDKCQQFIIDTDGGGLTLVLILKPEEIINELKQVLSIAQEHKVTFVWI